MKILMLGWELPPHNSGGLGVACYYLSRALAIDGATIDFVVPYRAEHTDTEFMTIHHATDLEPLHRNGMGAYDSNWDLNGDSLTNIRSVQRQYTNYVEQLVNTSKPDVIHAHDWMTMEAGVRAKKMSGSPLIVHVHATEYDRCGSDSGDRMHHEIEQQGLLMADRIIAVSEITKRIIVEKYHIPADKVEVVYNAIDTESLNDGYIYDDQTYKYLEGLRDEGYTIVETMTRFTIQKGLVFFVKAAAKALSKYDKLAFLLVGDGEQRDELVKLSADLGIADKLFFTGFVRGKKWRDSYTVSDVFVMSSVSEPFGLTALEAAHHGNAVIITRQSGVGEILHNVFRYDYWDENVLADQIVGIATSQVLRESLQQNVKREYNRISWDDAAKSCVDIYNNAQRKVAV